MLIVIYKFMFKCLKTNVKLIFKTFSFSFPMYILLIFCFLSPVWMDDHWDVRYIRHCAKNGEIGRFEGRECQEIYGTYNIRVRHCHCNNQDGCNSAPLSSSSHLLVLLSIGVVIFLLPQIQREND